MFEVLLPSAESILKDFPIAQLHYIFDDSRVYDPVDH